MTDPVNHEEAFVKAFIPNHRQERFIEIIANRKKRAKLLIELAHFQRPQSKVHGRDSLEPTQGHRPSGVAQGERRWIKVLCHVREREIGRSGKWNWKSH